MSDTEKKVVDERLMRQARSIEALLKEFMAETGLRADEIEMISQQSADRLTHRVWFRKSIGVQHE